MDYQALGAAYLKQQGYDPEMLKNPSVKDLATLGLSAYLQSLGIPAPIANMLAEAIVDKVMKDDGDGSGTGGSGTSGGGGTVTPEQPVPEVHEFITNEPVILPPNGATETQSLIGVAKSTEHYYTVNEAVEIDRYTKDLVAGFLPPMNWWDMLPDWPAISYTAIIMDQTRAAKQYIFKGLDFFPDEVELEIESHKYPYKSVSSKALMKGRVMPGSKTNIIGRELLQKGSDKDTVDDTDPVTETLTRGIISQTVQTNSKYYPEMPPFVFPEVYRDDLTDQKNPALDLLDAQKLVDEFLDIGKRIYDSQTENPTIFGFDDVNSMYEKDKNMVLANYKAFKANVRKMEHLNNKVESQGNNNLIKKINYRHDLTVSALTEEYVTRYLREKLLAWYNETDDPETKIWSEYHWLPGEPGFIEMLLTQGNYEWYNNLIAGLEDSVARLEDLEATVDLLASMANALGTWQKYKTAIEIAEKKVEQPDWDIQNTVTFTHEIIDQTMLKKLLSVSEIVGSFGDGELTPIRANLESLRKQNQTLLEHLREMSPIDMAYPTIWEKLDELCAVVNADIEGPLNCLILDLRGDYETEGKHSSPSHLMLMLAEQLALIVETVQADVENIINEQKKLPMQGLHRLDSMLNKINEIRMWGPMCSIPWHYWMAIDNVNAAERLYNDIWSDVFDCWEREYITRVWRVVTEHHAAGVIPPIFYGKPLFSAECPHHLPMLLAPVPVAYRDIDINYLSANCRKHFNFLCSWLTSTLYAIGVKRVALGAVINDSSLNGDDANISYLAQLNELNDSNNTIKDQIDLAIKSYNGTGELLQKADLDQIIAAKELSPTRYSNQVLLNMSSQLHLLNTFPVTIPNLATNENRMGTIINNSPPLEWEVVTIPEDTSKEEAEKINAAQEASITAQEDLKKARKKLEALQAANASDEEIKAAEEALKKIQQIADAAAAALKMILEPYTVHETLKVETKSTTGGPAEITIDTGVSSDNTDTTLTSYVGDVDQFKPWYYMQPTWDTQKDLFEPPIIPLPEVDEEQPATQEIEMPSVTVTPEEPIPPLEIENEVIPLIEAETTTPTSPTSRVGLESTIRSEGLRLDAGAANKLNMMQKFMRGFETAYSNREHNDDTQDT